MKIKDIRPGDVIMPPEREVRLWMRRSAAEKGLTEDQLGITISEVHEGAPDKGGRWIFLSGFLCDAWYSSKPYPFKFKARPETEWKVIKVAEVPA